MKDEALDFLPMLLLLGLTIFISFGLILPIYYTSRTMAYESTSDKTLKYMQGEQHIQNNNFDVDYNYPELIVALGSQTYFMPHPRVLDICGTVLEIEADSTTIVQPNEKYTATVTADYIPGNLSTMQEIKNIVYNWCAAASGKYSGFDPFKLHFAIRFTTGSAEGASDDCYAVFVVALNDDGTKEYYRCKSGGIIDFRGDTGVTLPVYASGNFKK